MGEWHKQNFCQFWSTGSSHWKCVKNDSETQSRLSGKVYKLTNDSCHCHWLSGGMGVRWASPSPCATYRHSSVTSLAVFREQNRLKVATPPPPSVPADDLASHFTEKTEAKIGELPQAPTHGPATHPICLLTWICVHMFFLLFHYYYWLAVCSRKGHLFHLCNWFYPLFSTKALLHQSSLLPRVIKFPLSTGWIFSITKQAITFPTLKMLLDSTFFYS